MIQTANESAKVALLGLALVWLLGCHCAGGGHAANAPQEPAVAQSTDADVYAMLPSIDTWQVSIASSDSKVDDVVAMFRSGGYVGRRDAFIIWRDSRGVFLRRNVRGVEYGWNAHTVLDLSGGRPVDRSVLDRLLALEPMLDKLPRRVDGAVDFYEYFIFMKKGSTIRKYFTDDPTLEIPDYNLEEALKGKPVKINQEADRFYEATKDLWTR